MKLFKLQGNKICLHKVDDMPQKGLQNYKWCFAKEFLSFNAFFSRLHQNTKGFQWSF